MNPLAKSRLEAALKLAKRSLEDSVVWQLSPKEIEQRETIQAALDFLLNPMVTKDMIMAAGDNNADSYTDDFQAMITTLTAEDAQ